MTDNPLLLSDQLELESEKDPSCFYLFQSASGLIEFVVIESEMEELNDYCAASIQAIETILAQHDKERTSIVNDGVRIEHEDYGDITDDVLQGIEEFTIPKWQEIRSFITHAICLLLLHTLLEKNLKCMVMAYGKSTDGRLKTNGMSKVDAYLNHLRDERGIEFEEAHKSSELRTKVRSIRNAFAHGDWEEVSLSAK
jgi:hypothetical protein